MSGSNVLSDVIWSGRAKGATPKMNKILVAIGITILIVGLLWPVISKVPFGKLPGDIAIKKEGFHLYFPITTMIVVSLVVSAVLWFFKK